MGWRGMVRQHGPDLSTGHRPISLDRCKGSKRIEERAVFISSHSPDLVEEFHGQRGVDIQGFTGCRMVESRAE